MEKTIQYKGRFYGRLPLIDQEGHKFQHVGLTESEVLEINKQHDWLIVREKRDLLVAETDWTQVPDSQLSDDKKAEFLAYRQALRDIPQSYSNPDDVVWPEKPAI